VGRVRCAITGLLVSVSKLVRENVYEGHGVFVLYIYLDLLVDHVV
jgi:hypothetical protein